MRCFTKQAIGSVSKMRKEGYIDDIIKSAISTDNNTICLDDQVYDRIKTQYAIESFGAGTELKSLLSKIGISSSPTCSCNKRAKLMDDNGIEWCENNISTIVDWLQEEHTKRKSSVPFIPIVVKQLISLAIRRAKKKILNKTNLSSNS